MGVPSLENLLNRCNSLGQGSFWAYREIGTPARGYTTFVPFQILRGGPNLKSEQFWGRAARAPKSRKRLWRSFLLLFRAVDLLWKSRPDISGLHEEDLQLHFLCEFQVVEIVKFTVMRASVSTACPACR
jgi:hypothetical protein